MGAAAVNAAVNPLLEWLRNRSMEPRPLWAMDGIVVDLAVTSVILSFLVVLFVARDVRSQLRNLRLTIADDLPRAPAWLSLLPSRGWLLGPALGLAAAVAVIVVSWGLHAVGVFGLSAAAYLVFKGTYCGCLGFAVARWAILRQFADDLPRAQEVP